MEKWLFSREEDISFWKNLILFPVFFLVAPITITICIFSLFSIQNSKNVPKLQLTDLLASPQSGIQVYASLPTQTSSVSAQIGSADARVPIIKQYLISYNSPLTPYADLIVSMADKYSVDFRLTTAIAQQESNLCKIIPPDSYNCWGWGITSVGSLGFKSFSDGIETVTKGLRENYLDKGYSSITDIMSKYTPQSNGSWAAGVTQFMTEMQ